MRWRTTLTVLAAAALPLVWPRHEGSRPPCTGELGGSFVQIGDEERGFDEARWARELSVLRGVGVHLVILQFTGDDAGTYDRQGHTPVAALLAAAADEDMVVLLGLYDDPSWPSDDAAMRLPPPLDDASAGRALGELCARSAACVGWYVSQEIDDETWASPERTAALHDHLAHTSSILRELAPGKQVAIAPFFAGGLGPIDYAQWWREVLEPGAVDVLILQDGVGTGRATPQLAGAYLAALRPVMCKLGVALWSVAELFRQRHGSPLDARPFAAVPIEPARLWDSLAIEAPLVERVVAFAVLPYMDPRRGGEARRLHDLYVARCRAASSPGRTSC